MKKLLLLLLMIPLIGFTQSLDINFKPFVTIDTYTITADTAWTFDVSTEYQWEFGFIWTSLDQTDGSVKIQYSVFESGETFVDFPNLDSLLLNSATGFAVMRGGSNTFMCRRIRVLVQNGTTSSGTIIWRGNLIAIKRN